MSDYDLDYIKQASQRLYNAYDNHSMERELFDDTLKSIYKQVSLYDGKYGEGAAEYYINEYKALAAKLMSETYFEDDAFAYIRLHIQELIKLDKSTHKVHMRRELGNHHVNELVEVIMDLEDRLGICRDDVKLWVDFMTSHADLSVFIIEKLPTTDWELEWLG